MDNPAVTTAPRRAWRGRLCFYHPTGSGSGAAARLEFHPARFDRDGCFFLEMARQKTAPARDAAGRQPATFDWEGKITAKLGFLDVCGLLLVLVWGARELAAQWRGRAVVSTVLATAAAVLCVAMTRRQIGYWQDDETVWTRAVAVTGRNDKAGYNLGVACFNRGVTLAEQEPLPRRFPATSGQSGSSRTRMTPTAAWPMPC